MDGFTLSCERKQDERLRSISFVFYTATHADERDWEFALGLGAERFIVRLQPSGALMAMFGETLEEAGKSAAS